MCICLPHHFNRFQTRATRVVAGAILLHSQFGITNRKAGLVPAREQERAARQLYRVWGWGIFDRRNGEFSSGSDKLANPDLLSRRIPQ